MSRLNPLPPPRIREAAESAIRNLDGPAAVEALTKLADREAAGHAEVLVGERAAVAAAEEADHRSFEQRLIKHWGPALELYELVAVGSRELGNEANVTFQAWAFETQNHLFAALMSLHARCCRSSLEVLALLRHGYPVGALGIWRSAYEYAVTARVLSNYEDHAERYLEHELIARATDAIFLNEHATALGTKPIEEAQYVELQREAERVKSKHGRGFASDYGWAHDLIPEGMSGFRGLEKVAGLDYMRPHYRLASHGVHSGARGGALNVFEADGARMVAVGPSNTGLADPGHGTLLALVQVTTVFVNACPEDDTTLQRAIALKALHMVTDQARDEFLRAELALESA